MPAVKQKIIVTEDVQLLSLPPDVGTRWSLSATRAVPCVCVCVYAVFLASAYGTYNDDNHHKYRRESLFWLGNLGRRYTRRDGGGVGSKGGKGSRLRYNSKSRSQAPLVLKSALVAHHVAVSIPFDPTPCFVCAVCSYGVCGQTPMF